MIEDGSIDPETLARACLAYMSESDVIDMANDNEFLDDDDAYDDDDEDEEVELTDTDYWCLVATSCIKCVTRQVKFIF